jgi:Mrp family chromosome partitioning ATPase
MSRMFRVISGAGSELPYDRDAEFRTPVDPFSGEPVPFVEVGGPDGVVTSPGKPPPAPRPEPRAVAPPAVFQSELPRPKSQAAAAPATPPDSRVLSVTFHRIPKPGLRLMQSGVAPEVVAYHFPDHPVSGEYRLVRDEIVKQFDEPGPKVTLFTAASAAAGTTTVLVNFAVSLIQEYGSRVLLVDANFARPGVARRLGCGESPGVAEVLGQAIPLAWALQPTPLTNLHVLATGTPTDATEEAMANDFPKLLTQLRQWFDWVVVDAGVWGDLPAADAVCGTTDAVYLVTRSGDIELPGFGGLRTEVAQANGHVRGYISTRQ